MIFNLCGTAPETHRGLVLADSVFRCLFPDFSIASGRQDEPARAVLFFQSLLD
jgi:hypothetical protein